MGHVSVLARQLKRSLFHPHIHFAKFPHKKSEQICTSADEGQTLGGCFHVSYGNLTTECVPHDAEPSTLQGIIEGGLNTEPVDRPGPLPYPRSGGGEGKGAASWVPGVGRVNVTTDGYVDDVGGRCWNVTFSSAVGTVGPMSVSTVSSASTTPPTTVRSGSENGNKLSGLGAEVTIDTLQAGNAISGNFSLTFGGDETVLLSAMASAGEISQALRGLPSVAFARSSRTDPASSCGGDGLCTVGQTPGGGFEWVVELGTRLGNTEPSSPTVAVGGWAGGIEEVEEGAFEWPGVASYLEGDGAEISVVRGWAGSADQLSARFNATQPFSIALGGAGASHGELDRSIVLPLLLLWRASSLWVLFCLVIWVLPLERNPGSIPVNISSFKVQDKCLAAENNCHNQIFRKDERQCRLYGMLRVRRENRSNNSDTKHPNSTNHTQRAAGPTNHE